ncbi:hypothetical protein QAD02_014901 [Eretmocerus hayati]|uniref:Uncharacterized protein n=1 Tax=Eretmocerus hayati TaxID=131215 RepID=A0ACC2P932_9HYME|nr:hypothetical protein QAD02_014901 [Eretmocerus hayati]
MFVEICGCREINFKAEIAEWLRRSAENHNRALNRGPKLKEELSADDEPGPRNKKLCAGSKKGTLEVSEDELSNNEGDTEAPLDTLKDNQSNNSTKKKDSVRDNKIEQQETSQERPWGVFYEMSVERS